MENWSGWTNGPPLEYRSVSENNGPAGPIFLEFWSPGPEFLPDQNFRDRTILIEVHVTSLCFRKSSVDTKVDGWKALAGISIGNSTARSCPTTLLEPAFLRVVNDVHACKPLWLLKAGTAQLSW